MASMAEQMKTRAKRATSSTRSNTVVKSVPRSAINSLNRSMEPMIRQNAKERMASERAVAGNIFGVKF